MKKLQNTSIKVGDLFMVSGPAFLEKAEAIHVDKEKRQATLSNRMKISFDMSAMNLVSINSVFTVERFDEDTYEIKLAISKIPRMMRELGSKTGLVNEGNCLKVYKYLSKISKLL